MIEVLFKFANEVVEVRVNNHNLLFRTVSSYGAFYPIEAIRLDKNGVIKEHPDLEGKDNWKEEAIKRLKEKLKSYENEEQRVKYIIEDLSKFGYIPTHIQKSGSRPIKINN